MQRVFIALPCLLVLGASAAASECTTEMDVINRNQIVNKGMLDLTLAGKMNHTVADAIGKQSKAAQKLMNDGEYQQACDKYDALIAEYGFKTFEESYYEKYPEKRPGTAKKATSTDSVSESATATAVSGSMAAQDSAVSASESAKSDDD